MNIKRLLISVLIIALAFAYYLPATVKAAHNDTTLSAGTLLRLTNVAAELGGTNGINITVNADSTCESVIVNPSSLVFSLDSGSSLSLRSEDRKIFSTSVADTTCNTNNSTWTYNSTTANETVTITFDTDSNCAAAPSSGSPGGGPTGSPGAAPPTTPTTPTTPADESTGEGETTTDVGAGETGDAGEVTSKGANVLMGEGASANFSLSGATGDAAGTHSLSVQNITTNQATFTVSSDPVTFSLTSGGSKNVDIDGDGYRDMKLTLNRIVDGKVDTTIKEIAVVKIDGALPGSLVKIASQTAVYYLGEDSQRYVFPHQKVYYSWYDNFDDVITISDEDMALLPLGGLVTYRPGTWMVTFVTTVDVWTVTQGGVLRKLKDEQMAEDLYGESWNQHIHDVNDAFYTSYSFGDDLDTADEYSQDAQKAFAPTITADKSI